MRKQKLHYAWWIMVACCALQCGVTGIGASTAGSFLASVSNSLGVGTGQLSLYITIQNIVMLLFYPLAGKLLTKYDVRLTVSIPVIGICLTFAAMSCFHSMYQFYLAGAVLGICYSFTLFLAIPMILKNWFWEKIGLALGISLSFSGIGGAVFNTVVGVTIQNYGWQRAYLLLSLTIAILVLPFSVFVLRMHPSEKNVTAYGQKKVDAPANSIPDPAKEAKSDPKKVYPYLLVFGACMGLMSAMQTNMANFSKSLGCTTVVSSVIVSVIMASAIFAKVFLGVCNDRFSVRKTSSIAFIFCLTAFLCMLIADLTKWIPLLFLAAICYSTLLAISSIDTPMLVRNAFPGEKEYAFHYSRVQRAYSLASAVFMPIYNYIFDYTGRYTIVILILLLGLAAAFVCTRKTFITA